MKKLLIGLFVACLLAFSGVSHATTASYGVTVLTGGTSGCLDDINGSLLNDGDVATVRTATAVYFYSLDADSAAVESDPDVIKPDDNAGDKRWILSENRPAASVTVEGSIEIATDAEAEAKSESDKALVPSNLAAIFLDEDAMGSNSATKLCSQQSIKAYVDDTSGNAIIGDATAGRVIRNLTFLIENGTAGNSIKVTGGRGPTAAEYWNATSIAAEDSLDEDETLTYYKLSIDGSRLTILAAGLDGNAVAGLVARTTSNLSTVVLDIAIFASANTLIINFRNAATGASADLRDLVNTGAIYVNATYLTDA